MLLNNHDLRAVVAVPHGALQHLLELRSGEGLGQQRVDVGQGQRQGGTASGVTLGPYTYFPAPRQQDTANGTLTTGGLPVVLQVTEPLLREFLDVMSALEADLARRWGRWEHRLALHAAE